jgi:catechol 2,3-dioxygenase-like lactoylglutathione lyase family enzyme
MVDRMPQRYSHGELVVVIDVSDLDRSATFWTQVLGYTRAGASAEYLSLIPADGRGCELLLQKVDDEKLGATQLTESPIIENGWTWHVLSDPDGNEFCVLQPPST